MKNRDIYRSWNKELLSTISEQICQPCDDERKRRFNINYENPIECGCHCDRVTTILEHARIIDEDIYKDEE